MYRRCLHTLMLAMLLLCSMCIGLPNSASAEEGHGKGSATANENKSASKEKKKTSNPKDIPAIQNNPADDSKSKSSKKKSSGSKADKESSASQSDKSSASKSSKSTASKSSKSAKSSKSTASKSSKSAKKSSKKSKSGRSDAEIVITDASHSRSFSQAEIDRYKAMPYETWESPTGTSDLGLPIAENMAQPYPYSNLFRQFDGNKCRHRGHDIGHVGEKNNGMGTVINSAANAVITLIGRTGENIGEFGKLDKRSGSVTRTRKTFPRQILVPGYGLVYPFSTNYGRWRSGMVIVTKVLDGPLKDYTIRYMHMGDIRHDLKVGDTVKAGEHIAIMGGTAVLDSWPHLHLDAESPTGKRIDLGPYIGLPETSSNCRGYSRSSSKNSKSKSSGSTRSSNKKSKSSKASSTKTTKPVKPKQRPRKSYTQKAVTESAQTRTLDR